MSTSSTGSDGHSVWRIDEIRDFRPTTVANCAFLTPEKIADLGANQFAEVNRKLIDQFVASATLPSVREVITISSGAAAYDTVDLYGELKAEEELAARALASDQRAVVTLRAYSMSGPFVRSPERYAFSGMCLQGLQGQVTVEADRPTFRRYTSVRDLLRVGLLLARRGLTTTVDSGGDLVEMGELAKAIALRLGGSIPIHRVPQVSDVPSVYASDGAAWKAACKSVGFGPQSLEEQIDETISWLRSTMFRKAGP